MKNLSSIIICICLISQLSIQAQQAHIAGGSGENSLLIDHAGADGILIDSAADNGVTIFHPGSFGVQINNAGLHGINISDPLFSGIIIANPGLDGILINSANDDGVEVAGGLTGINIHDVTGRAAYLHNAAASNLAPLYLRHGDDTKMDVEFSGHARLTSNGAFVFYLDDNNNSNNQFEIVNSGIETMMSIYEDGNAYIKNQLRIANSSSQALKIESPGADGLHVSNAVGDGVEVTGGLNGIYVHDVTSRAGHFHNASTSNIAPLYVAHGDDTKPDLSFGGHALITSNGRVEITLDANNNSNDNFIIKNSSEVPLFLVYENPLECVSRGKLAAWGDIVGLSNLAITGSISKGSGSFKIDHPLDPTNKYLYHSFVESPDMMNVYNGNTVTNANGLSTIEMPDWFDALNRDFRYQLTAIGSFAHLMIKEELKDNKFTIQSSEAHVKVSWQITGIRQDAFANENRIQVEVEKENTEKGKYLHSEAWSAQHH